MCLSVFLCLCLVSALCLCAMTDSHILCLKVERVSQLLGYSHDGGTE